MSDVLLTEAEAAALAKVHPRTIRRLIEKGFLPASNYGLGRKKLYRIEASALARVQVAEPSAPAEPRRRRRRAVAAPTNGKVWPPVQAA